MRLLHLEDDLNDRALVEHAVRSLEGPWEIVAVASRAEFLSALTEGSFDAIIADHNLPGFDGLEALAHARNLTPATPFVFFSGQMGEDLAVAALHAGAADYVVKDRMKRLPSALLRAVKDASERRLRQEAESSLAATQSRYQRLIDSAVDAIFSLSASGAISSLNPAFETITGWPRAAWLGRPFHELVADVDRAQTIERFAQASKERRPAPFELRIKSARGDEIVVELNVRYSGGDDRPLELFGIARDVTARKRDEALIREQAEIIDQAPVAIVITEIDGRVRYWNHGAEAMFGHSATSAVGRRAEELLDPFTASTLGAGRNTNRRAGAWQGEIRITPAGHPPADIKISMSLIRDESGSPTGRLIIGLDVTEKKRLEEQFMRAQRMENLGLLAAGIAHDLNNIFAPILMVSQLLRAPHTKPESHGRLLTTLDQSAQRGTALVKQILALAHGRTEGIEQVNLKHIARDLASMIEETFPRNIQLDFNIPRDLWPVRANPTHLHQALLNLCVNARDAMPAGGVLRLHLTNCQLDEDAARRIPDACAGNFVAVEVSDHGTGISPEILPHIWEPFFTTKGAKEGTGLGLSTVRGILRNLGGFAEVTSQPGAGTCFTLFFPAEQAPPSAAEDAAPTAESDPGRGECILVVDDEPNVSHLVTAILQKHGYTVHTANDGAEAIQLLRRGIKPEPNLVLTDLAMPNLDGPELLALLQREFPQLHRIVMTGSVTDKTLPSVRAASDALLLKPFKPDALLAAVQQVLKSGSRP